MGFVMRRGGQHQPGIGTGLGNSGAVLTGSNGPDDVVIQCEIRDCLRNRLRAMRVPLCYWKFGLHVRLIFQIPHGTA